MSGHAKRLAIVLALGGFLCGPAAAQGVLDVWGSVTAPPPPAVIRVTLDPASTALLVLDLATQTCNAETRPRCVAIVPRLRPLLEQARAKQWLVVYTLGAASKPADILPGVAMLGAEPVVTGPPDKFIGTDLEAMLKQRGIKTLVAIGAAAEGAVLQTASAAAFRGFDVVVPVDGVASGTLYAEQYTAWHLVNAPRLAERVRLSALAMIE